MEESVLVAGGGLVGALCALNLARRGFSVAIIERRPDSRVADVIAGRSINLALSNRGIRALEEAGIAKEVVAEGVPMYGRMIHTTSGELIEQPYGKPGQHILSVPRRHLNETLITAAEKHPHVHIQFGTSIAPVDVRSRTITLIDKDGRRQDVKPKLVIGADGAFSKVRAGMQFLDRFNYSQDYLPHAYKELLIPPLAEIPGGAKLEGARDGYAMKPDCLHIWPRKNFMMIALPNKDRSFTCTIFMRIDVDPDDVHGDCNFSTLDRDDRILEFFRREFGDAIPLMPTLLHDWIANPTSSLVTIRCEPYHYDGRFLLMGDAAHAVVPFYGQGCNAGFEDCRILDELIQQYGDDWKAIGPEFTRLRKRNGDAVAELALYNFKEMRHSTASAWFRRRKQLERFLMRFLPESVYLPLYSMVTFSHIPYADVIKYWHRQDRILDAILYAAILVVLLLVATLIYKMAY